MTRQGPGSLDSPDTQPSIPRRRPRRKKVILAERPGAQRIVRVIGEQEEIPGGEGLVRWLIGKQLRVAVPLAIGTAAILGALPALFYFVPALSTVHVLGLSLPWLVLGGLVYPLLVGVGIWHNTMADRNEQDFIDSLDD